jgi:GT2 family glycosyltransferase
MDRLGIAGEVVDAGPSGLYRIKYRIAGHPRVSVLMPTRDADSPVLGRTLLSIRGVAAEVPFNFSAWVNQARRHAEGDHLLVMHDDLDPLHPEWLESMLELSQQSWIGAVGAKLYYPHGALQHTGLIVGINGLFGRPFQGFAPETVGYYSGANCIRNYSAVSHACLMTRREVFDRVGGFDEALPSQASDVDYGLRVCEAGLRVVYTPYARLTHYESGGLSQVPVTAAQRAHLEARWSARLAMDPYYNPNLTRLHLDYRLA